MHLFLELVIHRGEAPSCRRARCLSSRSGPVSILAGLGPGGSLPFDGVKDMLNIFLVSWSIHSSKGFQSRLIICICNCGFDRSWIPLPIFCRLDEMVHC